MTLDPSPIERLTEALLDAPSPVQRDRALLDAALDLCEASWAELWRRVDGEGGSTWWPVLSRGDSRAAPDRPLVLETLEGNFSAGLPCGGHVLREGSSALVLGGVVSEGPDLELAEGLLVLRAATDVPLVDLLEAPSGLAGPTGGTRFSAQAARAVLAPETAFEIEGDADGAELTVDPEALASLLRDLGNALRDGGPRAALRVARRDGAGLQQLLLVAELHPSDDGWVTTAARLIARAERYGLHAERSEDERGMTLTLRLPIVSSDAA